MASLPYSGVSWRRLVNLEHPCLDINLHGFCSDLCFNANRSWVAMSFLQALPLAVCGLFWPQSPTARMVTQWVQTASLAAWLGSVTWTESRRSITFADKIFDNLKHGPWIHPLIPIGLVCTLDTAIYCLTRFLKSVFLRVPLKSLPFRARAMMFLGCVSVTSFSMGYFAPDDIYDSKNIARRWVSNSIRRFIFAPLLRQNKRRREALSTTFLGQGCHGSDGMPFTYSPLRSSKSIRLLEIVVSSQKPGTISAELTDFDISSAPPYEAISYRWGDSAKTHHIRLGHTLPTSLGITKSAYDALRAVTPLRGAKHVWIDSICIDQEAPAEKLQQIPLMGDIYEGASLVTAHVPNPGDAIYPNFHMTRLAWSYLADPHLETLDIQQWERELMLFPERLPVPIHDPGWHCLRDLVYNPIWERAWIAQETILASRWRLVYGEVCMSLEAIAATTVAFRCWEIATVRWNQQDFSRAHPNLDTTGTTCLPLFEGKSIHEGIGQRRTLVENLVTFLGSEATVTGDKVYALLGMSSDPVSASLRQKLQQDGFMTPRQLSVFLVRQSLSAGSFLTFSISGASQHPLRVLPSWAPDFKSLKASVVLATRDYHIPGLFSAGFPHKADYTFSLDGDELRIRGVLLDHVHTCSSSILDPPVYDTACDHLALEHVSRWIDIADPEKSERIYQNVLNNANLVREHIPDLYMGAMDPLKALCWTILQGINPETMGLLDEPGVAGVLEAMAPFISGSPAGTEWEINDDQEVPETVENIQGNQLLKLVPEAYRVHAFGFVSGLMHRKVAITRKGYLASVPWGTREGDVVCIFQGSPAPCILRPVKEGRSNCYVFHGETYVQGWMHGEAADLEKVWFTLR